MKIKALKNYLDVQLDRNIKAGEIYDVTKERAKVIVDAEFAEYVKEAKEEKMPFEEEVVEEPVDYVEKEEVKKVVKKKSKK